MEGIRACKDVKPEAEAHGMFSLQTTSTLRRSVDQYHVLDVIFGTGDETHLERSRDHASTAELPVFVIVLLVTVQMLMYHQ